MRSRLMMTAALYAIGVRLGSGDDDARPRPRVHVIDPPPRYRDTRCAESSMRPSEALPVRDEQVMSAAEAKRARKAAKRAREMHDPSKCCPDCGHTYCTCKLP